MIVWPAGLNNHLVPCEGYLDTKSYFVCRPWELGEGVVVQIVACIFLTIAQIVGSRIESASERFEEEKVHTKRERERRSMWYLEEEAKKVGGSDDEEDGEEDTSEAPAKRGSLFIERKSSGTIERGFSKRRSDGTLGPLQTADGFRETSFWNDTFDALDEDEEGEGGSGYLDVAEDPENDGDEDIFSTEAAMMLQ